MVDDKLLTIVTKLYKMYSMLKSNILNNPNVRKNIGDNSATMGVDILSTNSMLTKNYITYLNTDNNLLTNSETVIRRLFDACKFDNDIIVDILNIDNKLKEFPVDVNKLFSEAKYDLIIKLHIENLKYLESQFKELSKENEDEIKDVIKTEDEIKEEKE